MEIKYKNIENKIFIVQDNSIPITYISILFLVGNYLEKPNNMGINNLCFKTIVRSTKSMNYDSFQYYLEKNSVSLSSSTGNFSSGISISFPFYNYKKAVDILKEVLTNYKFRYEDIDESKRDLINSIKISRDDVWTYLYENADTVFYNSFLSWDTRGTPKTLKEITRNNLISWMESKVLSKNVKKIIVVSGYCNENLEKYLYKHFNKILQIDHNYYDMMKNFDIKTSKKTKNLGKKETGIAFVYQAPSISLESIKFKILNGILSSMSGRLFINIREKKELAYAITSVYDPIPFGKGNIKLLMLTSKEKKKEAINALKQEILNIINNGFNKDELETAKNYIIGLFASALQKRSFRNAILAKIKAYNLPDEYLTKHIDIIKKTSIDEINDLRNVFKTKESIFIVE
ncbi:MAG: insulinase family protein [Candidatus Calescibacterium sp.]|nr:insulinase family protein [Candidatus Calescibacterium sp.]MDW8132184.1 insulinase family protein [Candidatus Calescibacterium sp.]